MTNVLSRGSRLVALMGAVLVALGVHGTLLAGFEHLADNGSQHAELLARCCATPNVSARSC